VYKVS